MGYMCRKAELTPVGLMKYRNSRIRSKIRCQPDKFLILLVTEKISSGLGVYFYRGVTTYFLKPARIYIIVPGKISFRGIVMLNDDGKPLFFDSLPYLIHFLLCWLFSDSHLHTIIPVSFNLCQKSSPRCLLFSPARTVKCDSTHLI